MNKQNSDLEVIVDLLKRGTDRLLNLSESLLTKAKGETEMPENFSIHKILDDLVAEFGSTLHQGGVKYIREYAPFDIKICGSRVRTQQAFANIIKNAVEAMNGRGSLTITTALKDNKAIVTIQDTGPGMPKYILTRLFEGGFSAHKSNGHGIGLTVVKSVIDELNGVVEVQSTQGKGTMFYFEIPCTSSVVDQNNDPSDINCFSNLPNNRMNASWAYQTQ